MVVGPGGHLLSGAQHQHGSHLKLSCNLGYIALLEIVFKWVVGFQMPSLL